MKKRTNIMICEDVVKRAGEIKNMINDIHLIKREAMKLQLQGEIKEKIIEVIKIYNNQLKEIEQKNWANWESRGVKYLFRTFKKVYLLDFDERMTDDLTVLSEYHQELLNAMDKIHQMRAKKAEYSEYNLYNLYDNDKEWIDRGNFSCMDSAIENIKDKALKTGFVYYIIGDKKIAKFKIELNGEVTVLYVDETVKEVEEIEKLERETKKEVEEIFSSEFSNENKKLCIELIKGYNTNNICLKIKNNNKLTMSTKFSNDKKHAVCKNDGMPVMATRSGYFIDLGTLDSILFTEYESKEKMEKAFSEFVFILEKNKELLTERSNDEYANRRYILNL